MSVAALVISLAAVVAAVLAARKARQCAWSAKQSTNTVGRVRAELAVVRKGCERCQAGEVDEHTRMWRILAGAAER